MVPSRATRGDRCLRCRGTFLHATRGIGTCIASDPATWPLELFAHPPAQAPLLCPSGHGNLWRLSLRHDGHALEIDSCSECRGLWLDPGESESLLDLSRRVHAENADPGWRFGATGAALTYLLQLFTLVPVEVYNPVRRRPVLVYGLLGLLLHLFVAEIFLLGLFGDRAIHALALVPSLVWRGHLQTLVTHAFFHAGVRHLLGNAYVLWLFGGHVEDRLGRKRFVVLYLAAAIAGGLAHAVGDAGSTRPMIGASGAIAGLMGAYVVLSPRVKLWFVVAFFRFKVRAYAYVIFWLVLQLLVARAPDGRVAWLAHLGGFAAGALLAAWFARERSALAAAPTPS